VDEDRHLEGQIATRRSSLTAALERLHRLDRQLATTSGRARKALEVELGQVRNEVVSLQMEVARATELSAVAKVGGGKLNRTETVTVRLDPKLRYLAELAARLHRRTLSSYIEWAIKASLDTEAVRPTSLPGLHDSDHTIGNEAEYLWDVDDADRFAKLALRYPHLLTHEEQVRWKLIRECYPFWGDGMPSKTGTPRDGQLNFGRLRRNWAFIQQAAAEGRDAESIDLDIKD
jgi:hypothetical protein